MVLQRKPLWFRCIKIFVSDKIELPFIALIPACLKGVNLLNGAYHRVNTPYFADYQRITEVCKEF